MQHRHGCKHNIDISYPYAECVTSPVQYVELSTQHERVDYGEDDITNTKGVHVESLSAIDRSRAHDSCHDDQAGVGTA